MLAVLRDVREATLPFLPDIGERALAGGRRALDLDEAAALVRDGPAGRAPRAPGPPAARRDPRRRSSGMRLPGRRRPGRPEAHHGPRRRGAGAGRRRRLRPPGVSRAARPGARRRAERIYAGKEPGRSAMPQDEIDALLVERALGGRRRRPAEGRRSVRVRARRRGGARVRRGRRAVRGRARHHERRRGAGARRDPRHASGLAQSFAVVTGSTAHGEEVDLERGGHVDRHARRADGGRASSPRRAPKLIAAGRPRDRARGDRPVGGDARAAHDRRHAGRPAGAGGGGADRPARHARRRRRGRAPVGDVAGRGSRRARVRP